MNGERHDPISIDGLMHAPVRVTNGRWIPKLVTTEPPRYIAHTEFSWACELEARIPILPALIVHDRRTLHYTKPGRGRASETATILLSFRPHRGKESDRVHVDLATAYPFEGCAVGKTINDPALRSDPRPYVEIRVEDDESLASGTCVCIASVEGGEPLSAWVAIVAAGDTESCRCGRWRIKRRIPVNLPSVLSFIETGRRAGTRRMGGQGTDAS